MRFAALAGILVAAAVARVFAIDFCLPSHYCRPDEEAVGSVVMRVLARDLNPHWFDWPSLFMYLTALVLVPFFKVGNALGWYRGEYHFLQMLTADPEPVYLAARLLSASAGVVSVWLLYRTTRRWFGHLEALVASAFLALAFLHVRDSHFGVTDVTATCLGLASFACTVRFHAHPGTRTLLPAAALGGLAASTKYNLALILVPLAAAIALSADRRPAGKVVRDLVVAGAVALAGFLVATPYALLDYPAFVEGLRGISTHLAGGHGVDVGSGWWVHLTSSLRYGLGWPLLAAGLGGLALLLVRRPREGWLLALFPVTYYAADRQRPHHVRPLHRAGSALPVPRRGISRGRDRAVRPRPISRSGAWLPVLAAALGGRRGSAVGVEHLAVPGSTRQRRQPRPGRAMDQPALSRRRRHRPGRTGLHLSVFSS